MQPITWPTPLHLSLISLALLTTACSPPAAAPGAPGSAEPAPTATTIEYPVLGTAPELVGDVWINTAEPLRLAALQGRVVLLEMWTFGCSNCRNTLPAVIDWQTRFADDGLVVIGNHHPEFAYEADLDNLRRAVDELGITYPVVQDNAGDNFFAYASRYWPTLYLIDRAGRLRYEHIGEGGYPETERAIEALLAEDYD